MKKHSIQKNLLLILSSLALILVSSMMIAQPAKAAVTKASLLAKVEAKTSDNIKATYYAEYDTDGSKELFVVTGDEYGPNQIWFASKKEVKRIFNGDSNYTMCYCEEKDGAVKVSSKQKLFIMECGAGGSGSFSLCYYVSAGKVVSVVGKLKSGYEGLTHTSGANFTIHPSAFDAMSDGGSYKMGHTWKAYYLKWTGKGFHEYKGTSITQTTLKKYVNGSTILRRVKKEGYKVTKIYKRSNGIININLKKSSGSTIYYENVTLKLSKGTLHTVIRNSYSSTYVGKTSYGGSYKASIL